MLNQDEKIGFEHLLKNDLETFNRLKWSKDIALIKTVSLLASQKVFWEIPINLDQILFDRKEDFLFREREKETFELPENFSEETQLLYVKERINRETKAENFDTWIDEKRETLQAEETRIQDFYQETENILSRFEDLYFLDQTILEDILIKEFPLIRLIEAEQSKELLEYIVSEIEFSADKYELNTSIWQGQTEITVIPAIWETEDFISLDLSEFPKELTKEVFGEVSKENTFCVYLGETRATIDIKALEIPFLKDVEEIDLLETVEYLLKNGFSASLSWQLITEIKRRKALFEFNKRKAPINYPN